MKVTKANLHEEEATVRDANEGEDAQASVILLPPLADHVRVLCSTATHNITIASPWIKASALQYVLGKNDLSTIRLRVIMRADVDDFLSESSDLDAVEYLLQNGAELRRLPRLHAKVYIADNKQAIVTSANLTPSGLQENVEVGIITSDEQNVIELLNSTASWFEMAIPLDKAWLRKTTVQVENRREEYNDVRAAQAVLYQADSLRGNLVKLEPPSQSVPKSRSRRGTRSRSSVDVIPLGAWSAAVQGWSHVAGRPKLADQFVAFFQTAFAQLPRWSWEYICFGTNSRRISLSVGNLTLAAVTANGELRVVVMQPDYYLGKYLPTRRTLLAPQRGYSVCKWDQASELTTTAPIWRSYRQAVIQGATVARSRSTPLKVPLGKRRLADLVQDMGEQK